MLPAHWQRVLWTLPSTLWGYLCVWLGGAVFYRAGGSGALWYVAAPGGYNSRFFASRRMRAFAAGIICVASSQAVADDVATRRHEECHVRQNLDAGWLHPLRMLFWWVWAEVSTGNGYYNSPLEEEARAAESVPTASNP